jgi:hypothetical protein
MAKSSESNERVIEKREYVGKDIRLSNKLERESNMQRSWNA